MLRVRWFVNDFGGVCTFIWTLSCVHPTIAPDVGISKKDVKALVPALRALTQLHTLDIRSE